MSKNKLDKSMSEFIDFRDSAQGLFNSQSSMIESVLSLFKDVDDFRNANGELDERHKGILEAYNKIIPSVKDALVAMKKFNTSLENDYLSGVNFLQQLKDEKNEK
ncbi:hypothetical protein QPJ96_05985 [Pantoea agglomerans]|nr:hypothetical protein [Pantoea agglomerans]WIL43099.1 hypothetical protein QPJ96_05985 [Pantoea agglomerans]